MRRPDQARVLSAASLIRHEDNKKLTTMAALAFTVDAPTGSPSLRSPSRRETRDSAFRLGASFAINRRAIIENRIPRYLVERTKLFGFVYLATWKARANACLFSFVNSFKIS